MGLSDTYPGFYLHMQSGTAVKEALIWIAGLTLIYNFAIYILFFIISIIHPTKATNIPQIPQIPFTNKYNFTH